MLSDLIGAECSSCLKLWRSTADFERRSIDHGLTTTDPSLDGRIAILPAVFWIVRCGLCGAENRILWEILE